MKKIGYILIGLLAHATHASSQKDPPFLPAFSEDFPDPFILRYGNEFLAYATNATGDRANVQMARSTNLVDWKHITSGDKLHDAMPQMPPWARSGLTWAPEVLQTDKGFVLHFTARDKKSDLQCLGAAFSSDPVGPFTSSAEAPLLCQTELGGTIDSHAFRDNDGALYLYYKNDGNNPQFKKPTDIYVQRLSADGMKLVGEASALVRNDTSWEAHVIEAPTMVRHGDGYILFYSANHFGWETHQRLSPYAMGYAMCKGPMGPCSDAAENPILNSYNDKKAGCLSGPGHQSVFEIGGRQFISFHAWAATKGCRKFDNKRYMYIAPLLWKDGKPQIGLSVRHKTAR
ncbi:MAG: family 43 glycosylhydrolase [Sphingomonadaceae bacterium]|nr:family 43 glycosylhydrolase [Sphingomonadaceae bacterium]